ncbi:MAG: polyketide cyclase [Chloroflexi bacterium HGW-Chloroflexi-6]|nr:MAG: polyketide cyclase [Chloroflexi bacterium HGW-Chloroflexi-6]
MYHFIVKKIIKQGFRDLSAGDYEAVLKRFARDIHFVFEGQHALGSELHSLDAVRLWFQRVLRIFPGLKFNVVQIVVSGWPWNTVVVSRLQVNAVLKNGQPYQNSLIQIVRLRWGRVVDDYLLENIQKLSAALAQQAQSGIDEAVATPICD